jgi:hypothetical protein
VAKKITTFLLIICCGYTAYPVDSIFNTLDRIEVAKGLTSKTPEELEKRFEKAANLQKKRLIMAILTSSLSLAGFIISSFAWNSQVTRAHEQQHELILIAAFSTMCYTLLHTTISSSYIRSATKRQGFLLHCTKHSQKIHALLTKYNAEKKSQKPNLITLRKKVIAGEVSGLVAQFTLSLALIMQHCATIRRHVDTRAGHYFLSFLLSPLFFYGIKPIITQATRRHNKLPNIDALLTNYLKKIKSQESNQKKEEYLKHLIDRLSLQSKTMTMPDFAQ